MPDPATPLEAAFRLNSPRLNPRPATPFGAGVLVTAAIFWLVAIVAAFRGEGLLAFAVGVVSIAYDFTQLSFVAVQARKLFKTPAPPTAPSSPLTLSVIVAAFNEAQALPATLERLLAQTRPADQILVADDGSQDDTGAVLTERYGLASPRLGDLAVSGSVSWLRLPHRGKARTLNAALERTTSEIVVTVDADTLLDPDALAEIRRAFADPALIVGGGVLEPRCRGGVVGAVLQTFQRYEYVRNFLGRFAWSELDSLLLISGAFAAFRTSAVREVGGFDPASLTEDYELIHRLHRKAREAGRDAKVRIIGAAFATTDAPASVPAFLRQRRRWFAGFLQTQYWNRDMIGARRYGALGMAMLPVKSLDTAQPFYGLAGFVLLIVFGLTGRWEAFLPATGVTAAKIAIDLVNTVYGLEAHRRWTGGRAPRRLWLGIACILVEPFTFQPLRYLGAVRGWASLVAGDLSWGRQSRMTAAPSPE
jgi:cellulose synthase/poly-beta-1,6-N-acetylglucosamine synthase-like glycosyltransferase